MQKTTNPYIKLLSLTPSGAITTNNYFNYPQ